MVSTPLRPLADHGTPDVLDEILIVAAAAMYDVRKAGGSQARFVLNPALSLLDQLDDDDWPHAD